VKLCLLILALAGTPQQENERSSQPSFAGKGNGALLVIDVPDKVPLEFYVVEFTSATGAYTVTRSGEKANPPTGEVGKVYTETSRGVSFRIDPGDVDFAVGDRFSFVTFSNVEELDDLFDQWVNQYVKWIISREERQRFNQLQIPAEKLGFMESFWTRRDPDPSTPENETRKEHQRRFAYAVQHFGAGIPGWATDRGKIYILLGAPNAIQRNPAGRTAFERPSEVWTYNNVANPKLPASMDIGFVDFTATGRFEIVDASNLDILAPLRTNLGYAMSELEAIGLMRSGGTLMDQTTGFRYPIMPTQMATDQFDFQRELLEVAKVPELTRPSLTEVTETRADFPSLPLSVEATFFRADDLTALVPVTVAIPYARLTPHPVEGDFLYQADILIQIKSESGEELPPIQDRLEVNATLSELEEYRGSELLYETSLMLSPGGYVVDVLFRDNPSGALGRTSSSIEVPVLSDPGLGLSSLLLVKSAVETAPPPPEAPRPPFQFGNLRLLPNLSKRFPSGSKLVAYIQAHGFQTVVESQRANLRLEWFILKDGRLYSKVPASHHQPSGRTQIALRSDISLDGFPPGNYALRARITDEINEQIVERQAAFSVERR
jgi:GWxTD domain-containing protein